MPALTFDDIDSPAGNALTFDDIENVEAPGFWKMAGQNFMGGLQAAGDIATGDFQNIGEYKPTPHTEALADKLFPSGSMQGTTMENIGDLLYNMKTNTSREDYAPVMLEKFGESLPGKAATAIGGVVPTFNLLGTAAQKYAIPTISDSTGATEDEVALAMLAASPIGLKAGKRPVGNGKTQPPPQAFLSGLPEVKAAKVLTAPIRAPLKTAGYIVDTAGTIAKPIVQPMARSILESDNRIFGGGLKGDLASQTAKEGAALGERMGVDFTAGELTGNRAAMGLEDVFANTPSYADRFAKANDAKTSKIIGKFNETLDKIYPESGSRTDVGISLGDAYRGTLDNLIKTRREQAKIDFDSALKGTNEANILSNNLFRELQAIADEGNAKLLTKSKAHGAALARNILNRTSSKTQKGNIQSDTISLQDMANGLSDFSSEATRPGSILDNAQSAAERRVYARLYNALQKDLDAEIASPKGNPQRAAMLAVARNNFSKHSNSIADIQKTTLGKAIGESQRNSEGQLVIQPEMVADRFVKMQPSELKATMKFLDSNHPDIAQMARRHTLERALRISEEGRGLRGEGTTKEFTKAEFVKNLPDKEKLSALMGDSMAASEILDVATAMNRLIDYGASMRGSQTFGRGEFNKGATAHIKGALYRAITSDSLVEDLLNPRLRHEISFDARNINAEGKKP